MTPNSSAIPYLTVNDFLARCDSRDVGQLVRDDNTQATVTELQTDPNLAAAISYACGELESACLSSQKYAVADLQALNGQSLQYMKGILSAIIIYELYARRNGPQPSDFVMDKYTKAMTALDQMRSGVAIFAFAEVESAGNPITEFMNPGDWLQLNLYSWRNTRQFGIRNTYLGRGAGGGGGAAWGPRGY